MIVLFFPDVPFELNSQNRIFLLIQYKLNAQSFFPICNIVEKPRGFWLIFLCSKEAYASASM